MRFLIPCLFSCFIAQGQLQPILLQVKKDTIIGWNYHFGDEFEGNNIDLDKWFDRYPSHKIAANLFQVAMIIP